MKFGIVFTAVYLLTESTHAQIATRQKKRRDAGGVSKRRRRMLDGESSMSMMSMASAITGGSDESSSSNMLAAKSSKSSKGDKVEVKKKNVLIAILGEVPEYTGDPNNTAGTVTVRYNEDHDEGFFFLSLDAAGLGAQCAEGAGCRLAIKSGMKCDQATIEGEDYDATGSDVWALENESTNYMTYNGVVAPGMDWFSNSAFRASNGYSMEENEGHAIVLYGTGIFPMACGLLKSSYGGTTLATNMGSYPGYTGDLSVSGKVFVSYDMDQTFKFKYSLSGLAPNCANCGIHIHSGKSCNSHEEVMGHGWNSERVQDLWTGAGGAMYNSDEYGNAEGYFDTYNGFSLGQNMHHAVVIHTAGGARVACGVLEGIISV